MSTGVSPSVSEVLPTETWNRLKTISDAVLIDVRTKAEWNFVGKPDLAGLGKAVIFIEWLEYPAMSQNPGFVSEVTAAFDGATPSEVFFICRSGARSLSAATEVLRVMSKDKTALKYFNVTEGFEGDLNLQKHRGGLNGWKAHGLPWTQS